MGGEWQLKVKKRGWMDSEGEGDAGRWMAEVVGSGWLGGWWWNGIMDGGGEGERGRQVAERGIRQWVDDGGERHEAGGGREVVGGGRQVDSGRAGRAGPGR